MSGTQRRRTERAERALHRWLANHYHADVIGQARDLPKPERLLMKLVIGCEQCDASGKTYTGGAVLTAMAEEPYGSSYPPRISSHPLNEAVLK